MSLLREIQASAIDGTSDLETLLRKCRVLASRLQNNEFKQWVQSELDGYRDEIEVPEYRHIQSQAYGHFLDHLAVDCRICRYPIHAFRRSFVSV